MRHQSYITRSTLLGVAEAGNLKLDLIAKKHRNSFFYYYLNTFLNGIEIPKAQPGKNI